MKQELNILIPTDFSDASNRAVSFGITIAEKLFIRIFLLNSYKIPLVATEVPYDMIFKELELAKAESEDKMNILMDEIKIKNQDLHCVGIISPVSAQEAIEAEIKNKNIDLIVIGSKGKNALKIFLFGSVCVKLIEEAKCPVIVVPEKSTTNEIHKIIYATNLLDTDIKALQDLVAFAIIFDAEIIISHLALPEEKDSKKWFKIFKEDVRKAIAYKKIKYILKHESDFIEGMETLCSEEEADLIAMLTIERAPFEKLYNSSLTKKMSYHTEIPLMVFHSEE
jgi:nucleotide-binding universal stress UspA family protein